MLVQTTPPIISVQFALYLAEVSIWSCRCAKVFGSKLKSASLSIHVSICPCVSPSLYKILVSIKALAVVLMLRSQIKRAPDGFIQLRRFKDFEKSSGRRMILRHFAHAVTNQRGTGRQLFSEMP